MINFLQHSDLCYFPLKEFYEEKLTTDPSVAEQRRRIVAQLRGFWPRPEKPFVFCDIVGEESEVHTHQQGSTVWSKYNTKEATKIVHDSAYMHGVYEESHRK